MGFQPRIPAPHSSRLLRASEFRKVAEDRGLVGDVFLCNVAQRHSFSAAVTAYVPTLLCQSVIFNLNLNEPASVSEYCRFMGIPAAESGVTTVASLLAALNVNF